MAEWEVDCPVRLRLLAGHIYAATQMGMWGFGAKRGLLFSTSIYQKELYNLLELGGCLDYVKTLEGGCRTPALLGDEIGLVWIAEHYYREGKPACLILFGPVFLTQVRRANDSPFISQAIRESCDYIRANITKNLSLSDVAQYVGYTEYYFTRKFSKEMGIRVNDFVKEAKVEYAKIQLLTTSKGIQEISDALNFGNRTYFSRVFRDITGMTPAAFRNQMGREKEDESAEETET